MRISQLNYSASAKKQAETHLCGKFSRQLRGLVMAKGILPI
jgi:hypothetical protein